MEDLKTYQKEASMHIQAINNASIWAKDTIRRIGMEFPNGVPSMAMLDAWSLIEDSNGKILWDIDEDKIDDESLIEFTAYNDGIDEYHLLGLTSDGMLLTYDGKVEVSTVDSIDLVYVIQDLLSSIEKLNSLPL